MKIKTKILLAAMIVMTAIGLVSCGFLGGKNDSGKKVALTEAMIIKNPAKSTSIYSYTGEPVTFRESDFSYEVGGNYPAYSDFTYAYENNVNAGDKTAKLTISAKESNKYCTGSVVINFSIARAFAEANDKTSLKGYLANANYERVTLSKSLTVENEETLTIPQGSSLLLAGNVTLTNNGVLEINGELIADGSAYYQGGQTSGCLYNAGVVRNHGAVSVTSRGEIVNKGSFLSEGTIKNEGVVYSDRTSLPALTNEKTGVQYVRQELTSDDFTLPSVNENGVEFSQSNREVKTVVSVKNDAECDVTYENNDRVGTATVTVTAKEKDRYFFGSASKNFAIIPGVATVKNYEELQSTILSGNFDRYEITGDIVVPADADIFVRPGETLNFAGHSFKIGGVFRNNGSLVSFHTRGATVYEDELKITVNEGGVFDGAIDAEKISVLAYGDFSIRSPHETSFLSLRQNKGTLRVESAIKVPTLTVDFSAVLNVAESGSIDCDDLNASGKFVNGGTVVVSESAYFYYTETNANTGALTLGTYTYYPTLNLLNSGRIVNRGDFVCNSVVSYSGEHTSAAFDNTQGYIWAYENFGSFTENITIKKDLSDEIVALSYTEIPYDGSSKTPSFTIEGNDPDMANYTVTVTDSDGKTTTDPKTVGTYALVIHVKTSKCAYGGSLRLPYTIKKGTCRLTDPSYFTSVIKNGNYEKILLETDVILRLASSHNIALISDITLDTNGYKLTVTGDNNFIVEGELIVSAPTGGRGCSVLIQKGSNLRNHNIVRNNGVLCFDSPSEKYITDGYANVTFINDGDVYGGNNSNFTAASVTSGSGNVFVRVPLTESVLDLEYAETTYTGSNQTPAVNYTGSALTPEAFDAFDKTYADNRNAGTAAVTVKPDLLNETYYGSATLNFTIKKAVRLISSGFLYQSDFFDPDNYSEVKLAQSAVVTETINVPAGMNFNYSYYTLSFENNATLVLETDSVLYAEANNKQSFIQNISNVQKIIVNNDIEDRITLSFAPKPNTSLKRIFRYSSGNYYVGNLTVYSLTIDLCGHNLPGGLTFADNERDSFTVTFENSLYETTTSTIGTTTDEDYGFYQQGTHKDTNFVFNHLTIAGIRMDGDTSGNKTIVTGNYCTIVRDRANAQYIKGYALYIANTMNADTNFTSCTFQASTDKLAYIRSGNHDWNICNLTKDNIYYGPFDKRKPTICVDGVILPAVQ